MHLCWYKFLKFDSRWSGNYADLLGLKVETWDSNESKFNNVIPAGEQSEVLGYNDIPPIRENGRHL